MKIKGITPRGVEEIEKRRLEKIKILGGVVFWIVLILSSPSFSADAERIKIPGYGKSNWGHELRGYFQVPGMVRPNEPVFIQHSESTTISGAFNNIQYIFVGRTGDKSFELEYKNFNTISNHKTNEVVKLFFDPQENYPLKFDRVYTSCTSIDEVFLKMIKLNGNQLEYQILLPKCLSKKED